MGTLIFYQANEPSAWTLLPLLRRKPLDSNDLRSGSRAKKAKKATLIVKGVAVAFETADWGVHA
jgi:hypothetical protein